MKARMERTGSAAWFSPRTMGLTMTSVMPMLIMMMLTLTAVARAQEDWLHCPPCKCKWASGKKTAECVKQNFTQIPANLSSDIQILDLTGNRITYINHDAFRRVNLVNLHKLVLRECGIKAVHTDAFNGLEIVIEIDLSGNFIKTLFPGTFGETKRLRVLLLNHNDLETLENGLFHNLEFLQKVILSENHLERIGEKTFRNLPGLQTLTLDGNNLTNVRLTTFDNLPKLGSLELHNNPWNCNCHLKRFRDWTIERKLYTHPTTCALPATLTGKMWDELSSDDFACRPKIISIGPYPRQEIAHGDAIFWCRASGIPKPQLTWLYRSRVIANTSKRHNNGDRGYSLVERNDWLNLTIPDVGQSDKGEYICMAKNPGGSTEKNVSLTVPGEALGTDAAVVSLPLAIGLGVTFFLLMLVTIVLCVWYCRKRKPLVDEKNPDAASLDHHGIGEQEKSLITAINPVVKPPRRYEAPSVTSHGTEMTELNRTLLDNDSVFADGPGSVVGGVIGGGEGGGGVGVGTIDDEHERRGTPELENGTLPRGASYRHYPPDLLAFSGGRGSSPTSQASTAPDSSRLVNQQVPLQHAGFGSPSVQYPTGFKTLPHNRTGSTSSGHYSTGVPVLPRHGYVTIPRRPRAPSWSSGPPSSPTATEGAFEPVYDNLGKRTTADGSSVISLDTKSPEPVVPSIMRGRPLPGTPTSTGGYYSTMQRSTPNILTSGPLDRSAPEGAPEWLSKLPDEIDIDHHHQNQQQHHHQVTENGTLGRKVPPRPPPKPKKKSANGPLYEDEGEDGTEV